MSSAAAVGLTGVTELRVHNFSVSLDGYAAGPDQNEANPLGTGGERLHEWVFSPGATDVDRRFLALGEEGIGATIMGRNMFGPVRGPWSGTEEWTGWWGEDPPFHHDVFVLTHEDRDPLPMAGGTTFHFVTDGLEAALERAHGAAGDQDVRLGGASPRSGSTCGPACWTNSTSRSSRCCSAAASDSSTTSGTPSRAGDASTSPPQRRSPTCGCAVFDTMGA
jgi:dihydrofolate reductase